MPHAAAREPVAGRVLITSRIFAPEPSAASFRLRALANGFARVGVNPTVLTSREPREYRGRDAAVAPEVRVRRAPVLRDREGYVRGYVQYMSFDLPLAVRLLFTKRPRVVITEPPPTTGAVVRVVCALRRLPYVYYAADIWSDAVGAGAAPGFVARVVRALERFALDGAAAVLSVSPGVTDRLEGLGVTTPIRTVGNGVDLSEFHASGVAQRLDGPYFLYAGTASEVHGAGIFLDAFTAVLAERPDARLVFLGQGSDRPAIEAAAAGLPEGRVTFLPRADPATVAEWLRGAVAALASVLPGQGYDFAFPTKLYAAAATGTPAVYAGPGPGATFVAESGSGIATEYSSQAVSRAMLDLLTRAEAPGAGHARTALAEWAHAELGLDRVADAAVAAALEATRSSQRGSGRLDV